LEKNFVINFKNNLKSSDDPFLCNFLKLNNVLPIAEHGMWKNTQLLKLLNRKLFIILAGFF